MLNLFETILAGLTGALLMTLMMLVIHETAWARADMIRALGSLVTRSYDNAIVPGLLLHFASGALFAFPYVLIISGLDLPSALAMMGAGAVLGFVHGFVMSFILVAAVAEKHPLKQFQRAGFEVAAAHVFGHIGYGAGVAGMVGVLGIDYGFRL